MGAAQQLAQPNLHTANGGVTRVRTARFITFPQPIPEPVCLYTTLTTQGKERAVANTVDSGFGIFFPEREYWRFYGFYMGLQV
jgi:hypothetical protein